MVTQLPPKTGPDAGLTLEMTGVEVRTLEVTPMAGWIATSEASHARMVSATNERLILRRAPSVNSGVSIGPAYRFAEAYFLIRARGFGHPGVSSARF